MDAARWAYKLVSSRIERQRRSRLVISTDSGLSDRPTVYFLSPDFDKPSGGIRVIYRHVDILNDAGISAAVLHSANGFRATWFVHHTRIAAVSTTTIKRGDLLVVSELDVDIADRLPPGTPHVIFNQNAHMTWTRGSALLTTNCYANPDLLGVVVVSHHNEELLRWSFPSLSVHRVHLGIDPTLFRFGDRPREPTICYMPRRGNSDAHSVLAILRGRGMLQNWIIRPLDNLSEHEVGEQLRKARIFLSLSHHEGFGLPAAEAMSCGAFVIGYHGFSGREFLLPEFSSPVEPGDVLAFAAALERVLQRDADAPGWCEKKGEQASAFIREEYSPSREERDVLALYSRFLGLIAHRHPRASATGI